MDYLYIAVVILILLIEIIIFTLCVRGLNYLFKFLKKRSKNKYFDVTEYLPEEEVHTLRQVYYLIMMTLLVINLFALIILGDAEIMNFAIFEFILSIIVCEGMPRETTRDKLVMITLVPFASMMFFTFENMDLMLFDFIRIIGLIYGIKFYYNRFMTYTAANSLGHTILLLFIIIFISLFFTSFAENENLLNALVMVSNAFTSNGYSILGTTIPGKINAIFLVWSGYVLSGVGTATLTSALIIKHYDKKFDEIKEELKELKKTK